jgi:hypothetical protein
MKRFTRLEAYYLGQTSLMHANDNMPNEVSVSPVLLKEFIRGQKDSIRSVKNED